MFKHIIVATDGSTLSAEAVSYAVKLAKSSQAKLTAITVTEPFHMLALEAAQLSDTPESYTQHRSKFAHEVLRAASSVGAAAGVEVNIVHAEEDHPYQAIIDTARRRGCDLIVMASHGRRGVSAIVLGSETVKVLTHSTIPVLVLR